MTAVSPAPQVVAQKPVQQIAPPPAQTGAAPAVAAVMPEPPPALATVAASSPTPRLTEGLTPPAPTSVTGRCREIADRRKVASTQAELALAEAERLLGGARHPNKSGELNPQVNDGQLSQILERARALNGRARLALEYGAQPPSGPRPPRTEEGLVGLATRQEALADTIAQLEEKLVCDAPERAFKHHLRRVAADDIAATERDEEPPNQAFSP